MARLLEDGDELGLAWDDWADGRIWRLERGRDFLRSPQAVEEAARNAAARLDKAARTVRETRGSKLFVWVQFADYSIEPGESCPCGSDQLGRVNDEIAMCGSCGSSLVVAKSKQKGEALFTPEQAAEGPGAAAREKTPLFVPAGARLEDERKRLARMRPDAGTGDAEGDAKAAKDAQKAERALQDARNRELLETKRAQNREAKLRTREEHRVRREEERQANREALLQARAESARKQREAKLSKREQERERREQARPQQDAPRAADSGRPKREMVRRRRKSGRNDAKGVAPADVPRLLEQVAKKDVPGLAQFSDVRLFPLEDGEGRYWGYGYDRRRRVILLAVTVSLEHGLPAEDPNQPGRALHAVQAIRAQQLPQAVDTDALLKVPGGLSAEDALTLLPPEGPRFSTVSGGPR